MTTPAGSEGPHEGGHPPDPLAMNDEELAEFARVYELRLLPAIKSVLNQAPIGGSVFFTRRRILTIFTRVEAPPIIRQQIESAVAAELNENLRGKVSLAFRVGHIIRRGG
ncbi:hypothetical protein SAMD00023353_3300590 [Rosellinia necatrix]|uniref:Uncharacterized protein n=1 Tax=Rosellinia necatrix TaxID=77044 RepID=A0A1W2TK57_ROSNE|nr:hypothetical protein SAMD00023353_3300590 [Rosellinia necatrix]